jgi:hypothetical protein
VDLEFRHLAESVLRMAQNNVGLANLPPLIPEKRWAWLCWCVIILLSVHLRSRTALWACQASGPPSHLRHRRSGRGADRGIAKSLPVFRVNGRVSFSYWRCSAADQPQPSTLDPSVAAPHPLSRYHFHLLCHCLLTSWKVERVAGPWDFQRHSPNHRPKIPVLMTDCREGRTSATTRPASRRDLVVGNDEMQAPLFIRKLIIETLPSCPLVCIPHAACEGSSNLFPHQNRWTLVDLVDVGATCPPHRQSHLQSSSLQAFQKFFSALRGRPDKWPANGFPFADERTSGDKSPPGG